MPWCGLQIRPASPKYDERSFFYTTPALHPQVASPPKPSRPSLPTVPPFTPGPATSHQLSAVTPGVPVPDSTGSKAGQAGVSRQPPSPWATPMLGAHAVAARAVHAEPGTVVKRALQPELAGMNL